MEERPAVPKGRKPTTVDPDAEKKRIAQSHSTSVILSKEILLGEIVGSGHFGTVHIGRCRGMDVAVKSLAPTREMDEKQLDNFVKEIAAMSAVHHDNVIRIMGASTDGETCQMVMELMDGNLEELLLNDSEAQQKFTLYDRLMLARQAVLGLRWMHCSTPALIHSDLKLENIMFKKQGDNYIVKVADLGLSVFQVDKEKKLTYRSYRGGTPYTQAPEIWKAIPFNTKSDIYSLALCIWGLCSLKPLFPEYTETESFSAAILSGTRPPMDPSWPKKLVRLLGKMWRGDPDRRPDIARVSRRLDDILLEMAIPYGESRLFWKDNFETPVPVDTPNFMEALAEHLEWNFDPEKSKDVIKMKCLKKLLSHNGEVSLSSFGNFVHRFGPLKRGDDDDDGTVIDVVYKTLKQPWFHGDIDDKRLVSLLEDKPAGVFLIRYSSQMGAFAVVSSVGDGMVSRFRVTNTETGYVPQDNASARYSSLVAFVEDYKAKLGWETDCPGSEYPALFVVCDRKLADKNSSRGYNPSPITLKN